ncbi:acyl carrier protein [Streptomyces luteoverticillatus]|uniref:Acyl carrier protein n=1 Tax=Streptomyces luteoverticillatus TaxID=66425 RepID=A0A3S9PQ75_STRLT|nr:acyl carrier protein [Streptomyces luteoverticillatus]AZQ74569.1 acyl carrier protein [Streptomyces luteoverticillatus]
MSDFTIDELIRIMRECAGEDEAGDLTPDVADQDFDLLGYDSLALMATASRVEREHGLRLPEEEMAEIRTPAAFVALVNEELRRTARAAESPR